MSIKIKVNLPYNIYLILVNDMQSFGFVKADGTVNKNKFMNHLLKNFYLTFSNREDALANRFKGVIKDQSTVYSLISLVQNETYDESYYYDYSLQFILTKDNEKTFELIESFYFRERSLSQYFREMLIAYTSYSPDKRELLLFQDNWYRIRDAIKSRKRIMLLTKGGDTYTIDPYDLIRTKEELYNYVLGVMITKKGKRYINTLKFYKVDKIIVTNINTEIDENEEKHLFLTIEQGAQFPINEECDTKIELTKTGKKLFENMYIHRPKPYKIEGDYYYFNCSYI